MRRIHLLPLASIVLCALVSSLPGCTTRYQVRGTEASLEPIAPGALVCNDDTCPVCRARQIGMEHRSIENYDDFSIGIIEISDEGAVNPAQERQVMNMVDRQTRHGGLLVPFVHGWHHGARVCDPDLACFRKVLARLQKTRKAKGEPGPVVGVYLGWRGESLPYRGVNVATLWDRKRAAEHIGRTAGKEILIELNEIWKRREDLDMLTIGHSLGGALVFSAVKGNMTGNISDIELDQVRSYRVVRAKGDRTEAQQRKVKALRSEFGDLVVLVNPAIEAKEYEMFDNDLRDDRVSGLEHEELVAKKLPYDKAAPYDRRQLPILMTIASEADTANSRLFPPARILGGVVTGRFTYFSRSQWTAMGRYGAHVTHRLDYVPRLHLDSGGATDRDCGCSKLTELPETPWNQKLDLDKTYQEVDGFTFGLTPGRAQRGWDRNSPYLVIETNKEVIDEHSDIFNPVLVRFLEMYLDAYDLKNEKVGLDEKIAQIGAVDNHLHVLPALRSGGGPPANPAQLPAVLYLKSDDDSRYGEAWNALYADPDESGQANHLHTAAKLARMQELGEGYPAWVLGQAHTEVALVPEPETESSLLPPQFLWLPEAGALLSPFTATPSRDELFREVGCERLPRSLAEYSGSVLRPMLENWQRRGAIGVSVALAGASLEAAGTSAAQAEKLYVRWAGGGPAPAADPQPPEGFLLRELAREAGRAKLPIHLDARTEADPRQLESLLGDPLLAQTRFVLVGSGWHVEPIGELLARHENLYANMPLDLSLSSRKALRSWLESHPDRVLFGSDGDTDPKRPLAGWEEQGWRAGRDARWILQQVLGDMLDEGSKEAMQRRAKLAAERSKGDAELTKAGRAEVAKSKAEQEDADQKEADAEETARRERLLAIATQVLRGNALQLYGIQEPGAPVARTD